MLSNLTNNPHRNLFCTSYRLLNLVLIDIFPGPPLCNLDCGERGFSPSALLSIKLEPTIRAQSTPCAHMHA